MNQQQQKVIRDQVQQAYADAWYPDGSEVTNSYDDPGRRCLSFLTTEFIPASVAGELVKYIGGYNLFEPDEVRELLEVVAEDTPDVRVAIGREGSPVLYFDGPEPQLRTVWGYLDGHPNGPDEVGYFDDHDIGPSDILNKGTVHNRCDHDPDDAPVPDGQEAEPDYNTVLRAWWD